MQSKNKIYHKMCPICGSDFENTSPRAKYCSDKCKIDARNKRGRIKTRSLVPQDKIKEEGAVCCAICGLYSHNLSMHIAREHNIKAAEYKEKYNSPVMSKKMLQIKAKNVSGEKNPGWQHGGRLSAHSKNFYKYQDLSETEIELAIKKVQEKAQNEKAAHPERENTKLEYYLDQGMTVDEAVKARSDRQRTFSLKKCVEKYGEERGTEVWQKRQEKWLKTLSNKSDDELLDISKKRLLKGNTGCSSKVEKKLFDQLKEFFPSLKPQHMIQRSDKRAWYLFDMVLGNKIIEFNGDVWHANPQKYLAEDLVKMPSGKTYLAQEIWDKDFIKNQCAIDQGFDILIVWESDYYKNSSGVIELCKNFLTQ